MKRYLKLILLFVVTLTCSCSSSPERKPGLDPAMFEGMDKALLATIWSLHGKYLLQPIISGSPYYDKLPRYDLQLVSGNQHGVDEARQMIVDIMDTLAANLNKEPSLKPFVPADRPLNRKDIHLVVLYMPVDGKVSKKYLASVYCDKDGLLTYRYNTVEKDNVNAEKFDDHYFVEMVVNDLAKDVDFLPIVRESLDEAVKKLEKAKEA